jgi:muramoyltetrapeptide carboxypeptidase LdcA involved in peptidoglycan recycling
MLLGIIANNATLKNIPIIANVDFGHTHPIFTFPIGGRVKMSAVQGKARIGIVKH